jgi:ubiquinone/menaquinone biosynthesis C-methylase UbiE
MTSGSQTPEQRARMIEVRRRAYAKEAPRYDRASEFAERRLLGTEHREWVCSRAAGQTLEVAIGTGLNLAHYPQGVDLTGIDLSPDMLALAAKRAKALGVAVKLTEGDAQRTPFPDGAFDTVVCTYALCSVPDDAAAIAEMRRVLRAGGRLILVDHIRSSVGPILWLQWLIELVQRRTSGEYLTRRPSMHLRPEDFRIEARDRLRAGVVERVVAVKTAA